MSTHPWRERLEAALDERRDPLDDAELLAALERNDEALEELAEWRALERAIAELPRPVPKRCRPWLAIALAASAIFGVGLWRFTPPQRKHDPAPRSPALTSNLLLEPAGTPFRVRTFSVSIEHRRAQGTRVWRQEGWGDRATCITTREARSLVAGILLPR
ncbi:MAG: hypothetical protein IPN34_05410 [Planctomycetes bacterium]|nr:hypothetical protein [Planctomycetota bacterium]